MPAPPKPWETNGAAGDGAAAASGGWGGGQAADGSGAADFSSGGATSSGPPPLPPSSGSTLGSGYGGVGGYGGGYGGSALGMGGGYGGMGSMYGGGYGGLGTTGYGGLGGYGGGMGSMYGGGYGGMGSMYGGGGYGGMGYGGVGGYGGAGAMGGPGMDPTEETWAMRAEQNSRPAFEAIQQIVMAFGQVAMMLDASFGAMFQSFRAVIGVMDHFGRMRYSFGSMLATLSAVRIARQLLARVLRTFGITPPPHLEPAPDELLALESAGEDGEERQASWPLWLFFTVAIGGPYMMYRLLSSDAVAPDPKKDKRQPVRARALWDFAPTSPRELGFKANDILTVFPPKRQGQYPPGWVLAGCDDGRKGLVPAAYIRMQKPDTSPSGSDSGLQDAFGDAQGGASGGDGQQMQLQWQQQQQQHQHPQQERRRSSAIGSQPPVQADLGGVFDQERRAAVAGTWAQDRGAPNGDEAHRGAATAKPSWWEDSDVPWGGQQQTSRVSQPPRRAQTMPSSSASGATASAPQQGAAPWAGPLQQPPRAQEQPNAPVATRMPARRTQTIPAPAAAVAPQPSTTLPMDASPAPHTPIASAQRVDGEN